MGSRDWLHFGVFLVGFCVLLVGIFGAIAATEYEITHQWSTDDQMEVSDELGYFAPVEYEELSAEERRIVDDTLDGEELRFDSGHDAASRWGNERVVEVDGRYHYITRDTAVDWSSPLGLIAFVLLAGGFLTMGEAVRRHHFPRYRPLDRIRSDRQ